MGKNHSARKSFGYAFKGVRTAFKREPNFKIHIIFATAILVFALYLRFSLIEWIILTFTIVFVITLELLNTVLEALTNLISPDISEEAEVAKDVSASMVLVAAMLSVIVGMILFIPKILAFF